MPEIHVRQDGQVVAGKRIIDRSGSKAAHRDAIQIIPQGQYAGGIISDVEIRNNIIESNGFLQGVFCSDGGIRQGWITDNQIDTRSAHKVSVCMFSGRIANNRNSQGDLVPVQLYPLRIGGNEDGRFNVYVLSFVNAAYQYAPVSEIVKDGTLGHVTDYRFGEFRNDNDVYLVDFDLDAFVAEVQQQKLTPIGIRSLAMSFGEPDILTGSRYKKNGG